MKCSLGISNFLEEISSLLLFSSISFHCSFKKAFLSLLAILWNSAFSWEYLSLSPLPFPSLFFLAICKTSSETLYLLALITWITALCNSRKLWVIPCRATTSHGGEFWKNVIHWRREWQSTLVFLPQVPHKQWERERLGRFGRMALKHVKYHVWNEMPVQVRCTILDAWG